MKYNMQYSLHESKGAFLEQISGEELDDLISEAAREELNYAFYEVTFNIEIDTEKGTVKILEIVA
jgi:hypothetical protein